MKPGCRIFLILFFLVSGIVKSSAQSDSTAKPVVLIYPDPNQHVFFVSTGIEYLDMDISVNVYDLSGRMVEENMIKGGVSYGFFVGNLNTGIYFIMARKDGVLIGNKKISVLTEN
jgi:hypothetical protein